MLTKTEAQTNILTARESKREFLRPFNVIGNTNTYCGLQVYCPIFFPGFNQIPGFQRIFIKIPNIIFHINPSSGSRADGINAKRRTGMTNVTDNFHEYAKSPINVTLLYTSYRF